MTNMIEVLERQVERLNRRYHYYGPQDDYGVHCDGGSFRISDGYSDVEYPLSYLERVSGLLKEELDEPPFEETDFEPDQVGQPYSELVFADFWQTLQDLEAEAKKEAKA